MALYSKTATPCKTTLWYFCIWHIQYIMPMMMVITIISLHKCKLQPGITNKTICCSIFLFSHLLYTPEWNSFITMQCVPFDGRTIWNDFLIVTCTLEPPLAHFESNSKLLKKPFHPNFPQYSGYDSDWLLTMRLWTLDWFCLSESSWCEDQIT